MIPFNTQFFKMSFTTIQIALRLVLSEFTVLEQCLKVWFDCQADVTLAVFEWQRLKDASSVRRQPHRGKVGISTSLWILDSDWVFARVCVSGWVSLRQSFYSAWVAATITHVEEKRLWDPQSKINKKQPTAHVSRRLWHHYSQSKTFLKYNQSYQHIEKRSRLFDWPVRGRMSPNLHL